jgi:probable HAF family extracellular repeat protein
MTNARRLRSLVAAGAGPAGPASGAVPADPAAPHARNPAFLLDRGRFVRLDVPGARYPQAVGVDNLGQVVGEYQDAAGGYHGFRWQRGRFGIDDRGQVVGSYVPPAG